MRSLRSATKHRDAADRAGFRVVTKQADHSGSASELPSQEGPGVAVIDLRQKPLRHIHFWQPTYKARLVSFTHYWLLSEVVSGADDLHMAPQQCRWLKMGAC
jgi:hypothetical protein